MTLRTQGGKILTQGGKLSCDCCGGDWYCYSNPCDCWTGFAATLTAASDPAQLVPTDSLASAPWKFSRTPEPDGSVSVDSKTETMADGVTTWHSVAYFGGGNCRAHFNGYPLLRFEQPYINRGLQIFLMPGMWIEIAGNFWTLPGPYSSGGGYPYWDAITALAFGGYTYSGPPFPLTGYRGESAAERRIHSASYAASIGFTGPQVVPDANFAGAISISGAIQNDAGKVYAGSAWDFSFAFHPMIYGL